MNNYSFALIFALLYTFTTTQLSKLIGEHWISQLNYGLIIGSLVWIGIRIQWLYEKKK